MYRLIVAYPEGSQEYDWEPQGWEPEHWGKDPETGADEHAPFSWPGLRNFLSRSGAEHRAWEFMKYGATVAIEESEPIAWSGIEKPVRPDPTPPAQPPAVDYLEAPF